MSNMPNIPKTARMTAFHAGADVRGDDALARAITTGAPVATNDKQAAELKASKFELNPFMRGDKVRSRFQDVTVEVVDVDGDFVVHEWPDQPGLFRNHFCGYVLVERPTPRPTPPASSGTLGIWYVTAISEKLAIARPDGRVITVHDFPDVVARLNAADAMEAENKRLRDALQEWVGFAESAVSRFHPDDTVLVEQVKRLHGPRLAKSLAALRGGA